LNGPLKEKEKKCQAKKKKPRRETCALCTQEVEILDEKGEINDFFLNEERIRGLGRYR
jgi:hypothetical protein